MSSLLDLAAQQTTVSVGGKDIDVFGISAEGIAHLLQRFPALLKAMSGGGVTQADLIKTAPGAVAAIIASGCGQPGNAKAEAIAAKLGLEAQLDLVNAILKLTFPNGVGPFVAKMEALGLLVQAPVPSSTSSAESSMSAEAPDTKTPSR